jgi:hypothetical protein
MGYGYYAPEFAPGYEAATEVATGAAAFALVFLGVICLISLVIGVAAYVLRCVGIYNIAKHRGIHNPWLAWLPIGDAWVVGSISDQYQYLVKGKTRARRNVLMGLSVAQLALALVYAAFQATTVIGAVNGNGAAIGAGGASLLLVSLVMMVVSVVFMVFQYITLYDLYRSCDPDNAVIYLVLSIIVPISMPVLLFVCRNKDYGMPARLAPQEVPVYTQDPPVYPYS